MPGLRAADSALTSVRAAPPEQCYIKRVRSGFRKLWPYYTLYVQDPDKFLLAGRRRKKNKQSM